MSELATPAVQPVLRPLLLPAVMASTFVLLLLAFVLWAPGFASVSNVRSVLLNNVAPLAIVALAMTLVTRIGAIDLSTGTAIDIACLVLVVLMLHQVSLPVAITLALTAALLVGAFNALLVTVLGVEPFLATLGTLFIGQSVQQLSSNGGQPEYLLSQKLPEGFSAIGHGTLLDVPVPLWLVLVVALGLYHWLHRSASGRALNMMGVQHSVAYYSGVPVKRLTALAFLLCALISGLVGLILAANVKAWVPLSGNAYLLNAIGASFIGATFSRSRRPNVPGTLLGVLLLGFIANGLLLVGWNFYWQQVATGVLIFIVLAVGALRARRRG
ncbi:branched-chain amino acid ABC transporter permease [Enterobacterales bacterium CwR94]|nr:branched-chain amino acid ABC transporter permease [Enterobacterales bacterium CwR94]